MGPQVNPGHYLRREYDSKARFISYWHQINAILSVTPKNVLEIGIGGGLVSGYLKDRGVPVTTLDIDERLSPDIVGSVTDIPAEDNTYELVACFQVLEHLRYEDAERALAEIARVSSRYAIISLPDTYWYLGLQLMVPRFPVTRLITLPRLKNRLHRFDGKHHWEIGKKGYPLRRIVRTLRYAGFELSSTYRSFANPYHRFFILKLPEP